MYILARTTAKNAPLGRSVSPAIPFFTSIRTLYALLVLKAVSLVQAQKPASPVQVTIILIVKAFALLVRVHVRSVKLPSTVRLANLGITTAHPNINALIVE